MSSPSLADRAVAGRVVLAAGGGYGVAALSTVFMSLTLPLARSEASATGTLLNFVVMAGIVMLVFAVRTLWCATLIVAAVARLVGAGAWWAQDAAPATAAVTRTGGAS